MILQWLEFAMANDNRMPQYDKGLKHAFEIAFKSCFKTDPEEIDSDIRNNASIQYAFTSAQYEWIKANYNELLIVEPETDNSDFIEYLSNNYHPCGLNADFWCSTWCIKPNIYICDIEENNTFVILSRNLKNVNNEEIIIMQSTDTDTLKTVLEIIRKN